MRRGLYEWVVLAALAGSTACGGTGGGFVVDGVPQRVAGAAGQAYGSGSDASLSVVASNATRLIQVNTQAWVTVTSGTAMLWQVSISTQLVCSGAGTAAVNGRYVWNEAIGFYVNVTNSNITLRGDNGLWVVYWDGSGGWFYHKWGYSTNTPPTDGTWFTDFGSLPMPVFTWVGVVTTNAFPLARVADLTPYYTAAQLTTAVSPSRLLYVDAYRTNAYVPDGTILRPYTNIQAALNACGDAVNTNVWRDPAQRYYRVSVAPGRYVGDITIPWRPHVSLDLMGAVIVGNVTRRIPDWPINYSEMIPVVVIRGDSLCPASMEGLHYVVGVQGNVVMSQQSPIYHSGPGMFYALHIINAGVSGEIRFEQGPNANNNYIWGHLYLERAQVHGIISTNGWGGVALYAHNWVGEHSGGGSPGSGIGPIVGNVLPMTLQTVVISGGMRLSGLADWYNCLWHNVTFESGTYDVNNVHFNVTLDTASYRSWLGATTASNRGGWTVGSKMFLTDEPLPAGGSLTNVYGWMPADFLYKSTLETLSNGNGESVFTKHDKTKVEYGAPVSCPTPDTFTSNVVFRWYTYHTQPGTYAMACRWRESGLNAWVCVTSGLFTASTALTNLSAASLATRMQVGPNALIEMEYWIVPTNAPGGGTAGGFGYVKGMGIGFEAHK